MIWVVTGATGLIGRALVPALLASGDRVLALSRSAAQFYSAVDDPLLEARNFDLASDDTLRLGNLTETAGLIALAARITTSGNFVELMDCLALDTYGHLLLLGWMQGALARIVYASSCTVYGWPERLPVTETAVLAPANIYALTKVASEQILTLTAQNWRVPLTILRIAQVYGPGAPRNAAMYNFLKAAHRGERPRITCDPAAFRDYCHVTDVVQAIQASIVRQKEGVYNIGGGSPVSVGKLARVCLTAAGCYHEPEVDPLTVGSNMWLDISLAKRDLEYEPKIVLSAGVQMEYQRLYMETTMVSKEG